MAPCKWTTTPFRTLFSSSGLSKERGPSLEEEFSLKATFVWDGEVRERKGRPLDLLDHYSFSCLWRWCSQLSFRSKLCQWSLDTHGNRNEGHPPRRSLPHSSFSLDLHVLYTLPPSTRSPLLQGCLVLVARGPSGSDDFFVMIFVRRLGGQMLYLVGYTLSVPVAP